MSKESLVKVSPHLETKALSILNVKNPLDSPDFDPTQYLNKLFPNGKRENMLSAHSVPDFDLFRSILEQSLASVDGVLNKLQVKMDEMSQEAERLTDTQFSKGGAQDGSKELDKAKQAIQVCYSADALYHNFTDCFTLIYFGN